MTSLIIAFFTAVMAALLGVVIVRKSQINYLREREMRRDLIRRVEVLPLPHVVQALGINMSRYFFASPYQRLDECVQKCESCGSSQQCQTQLASPEISLAKLMFCPLREQLGKHID